jgi:hypothetical protein
MRERILECNYHRRQQSKRYEMGHAPGRGRPRETLRGSRWRRAGCQPELPSDATGPRSRRCSPWAGHAYATGLRMYTLVVGRQQQTTAIQMQGKEPSSRRRSDGSHRIGKRLLRGPTTYAAKGSREATEGNSHVPSMVHALHGSEADARSHLHFDLRHWSQAG